MFETPKTAWLIAGALILSAHALAGLLESLRAMGPTGFLRALPLRAREMLRRNPLAAATLLFLASTLASTFVSPSPPMSIFGAPERSAGLLVACSTVAFCLAFSKYGGGVAGLERLAWAVAVGAAAAAGYAALQVAGLDPLNWENLATYGDHARPFGTLGHPDMLGNYLAMAVPVVLWLASRRRGAARALLGAIAAAAVLVVVLSLARGAWLGLMAAGAAWATLRFASTRAFSHASPRTGGAGEPRRTRVRVILFGAGAVLLASLVFVSPASRSVQQRIKEFGSVQAGSTKSRLLIWRAGLAMFRDHPALGVGTDAFGAAFPRYSTADLWRVEWGITPIKAHNEAIQVLATQGAFGGAAALLVVLAAAWGVLRAARCPDRIARGAAAASGAALAAFFVQDLTSFTVAATGMLAAALAGWSTTACPQGSEAATAAARIERSGAGVVRGPALAAYALAAVAALPLVARPLVVEHELEAARKLPPGSEARISSLAIAARWEPWAPRALVRLDHAYLDAASRSASIAEKRRLYGFAVAAGERATQVAPWEGFAWTALGEARGAMSTLPDSGGAIRDAQAAFAEARRRDPVNGTLLQQEAEALVTVGRPDLAREAAVSALRLYPDFAPPLGLLGYLALAAGRDSGAVDTLRLAVARGWAGDSHSEASAWSNLSVSCLRLGQAQDAADAARRAIAIEPGREDARAELADAERALARIRP